MILGLLAILLAATVAYGCAWLVLRHAGRLGVVQIPNARSSHSIPTPSGGGVGIVAGGSVALLLTSWSASWTAGVVVVVALLIAGLGFADDRRPVPPPFRLLAQFVLVAVGIWFSVPLDALRQMIGLPLPVAGLAIVAVVAAVYWVNLFNFMDGIDGIAGSQAIFMAAAGALLAALHGPNITEQWLFWALLGVAAASFGFLLLNWPPAKIFMGDAGSTYLGFMITILALLSIAAGWLTLWQWAILGVTFVTDASVTLIRRLVQRERIFEAHRRHAYQALSRRWGSHRRVTLTFIAINLVWALPLAALAALPGWGLGATAIAYLPLVAAALWAGAGAPETPIRR